VALSRLRDLETMPVPRGRGKASREAEIAAAREASGEASALAVGLPAPLDVAVVAGSRSAADSINARVREKLRLAGAIGPDVGSVKTRNGELHLAVGDIVRLPDGGLAEIAAVHSDGAGGLSLEMPPAVRVLQGGSETDPGQSVVMDPRMLRHAWADRPGGFSARRRADLTVTVPETGSSSVELRSAWRLGGDIQVLADPRLVLDDTAIRRKLREEAEREGCPVPKRLSPGPQVRAERKRIEREELVIRAAEEAAGRAREAGKDADAVLLAALRTRIETRASLAEVDRPRGDDARAVTEAAATVLTRARPQSVLARIGTMDADLPEAILQPSDTPDQAARKGTGRSI
jgi:hypothetical protein